MARPKEEPSVVIAFRIPQTRELDIRGMLEDAPAVGVKSPHQFGRKILLDYLAGKLVYIVEDDKSRAPDA